MSVPREFYDDDYEGGFLEDRVGNMINPAVEHPLYLQAVRMPTAQPSSRMGSGLICASMLPRGAGRGLQRCGH